MSAPPTLMLISVRPRVRGTSTKLPTKMSPSTARAWVSVRCMRSSARWAAPNRMRAASAKRMIKPSGTGLAPFPASVPAGRAPYARPERSRAPEEPGACKKKRPSQPLAATAAVCLRAHRRRLLVLPLAARFFQHLAQLAQAVDHVADGDALGTGVAIGHGLLRPRLALGLGRLRVGRLDAQADATRLGIEVDHLHLDVLARLHDVGRVFNPVVGQLRDVHQALDAVLQLHERAEVHRAGHFALDDLPFAVALLDGGPRIRQRLLQAERDALPPPVDAQHLHLNRLAFGQHVPR